MVLARCPSVRVTVVICSVIPRYTNGGISVTVIGRATETTADGHSWAASHSSAFVRFEHSLHWTRPIGSTALSSVWQFPQ